MSSSFLFFKFIICFAGFSSLAAEDYNLQQGGNHAPPLHHLDAQEKAVTKHLTDEIQQNLVSTGDYTGQLSTTLLNEIRTLLNEKHPPNESAE